MMSCENAIGLLHLKVILHGSMHESGCPCSPEHAVITTIRNGTENAENRTNNNGTFYKAPLNGLVATVNKIKV